MKANFNLEKEARKALVKALGEVTGQEPAYQGAPSFAFAVGGYTVDRCGSVDFGDADRERVSGLLSALSEKGFAFEGELDGIEPAEFEQAAEVEAPAPASGEDGDSSESGNTENRPDSVEPDEAESVTAEISGSCVLSIDMPLTGFTASALDNLERLVAAKAWIIRKMTGADDLPIVREADCLRFPWFKSEASAAETDAYSRLIAGLCETAKKKQRVTATERRLKDGDNEKFKARCFLLSLNFIGDEYKQARTILLSGFSGDGSHSTGSRKNERKGVVPAAAPVVGAGDGVSDDQALAEALADAELIHAVNASFESGSGESGADQGIPTRCGDCNHHCYYTGGVLLTNTGETVDTSKRAPDKYTHYCLGTPRGFRKLKHANDWSGSEIPASWCPLRGAGAADDEVAEMEVAEYED